MAEACGGRLASGGDAREETVANGSGRLDKRERTDGRRLRLGVGSDLAEAACEMSHTWA